MPYSSSIISDFMAGWIDMKLLRVGAESSCHVTLALRYWSIQKNLLPPFFNNFYRVFFVKFGKINDQLYSIINIHSIYFRHHIYIRICQNYIRIFLFQYFYHHGNHSGKISGTNIMFIARMQFIYMLANRTFCSTHIFHILNTSLTSNFC